MTQSWEERLEEVIPSTSVVGITGILDDIKSFIRQERITLLEGIKKELIEKKDMDHEANYGYGKEVVGLQDAISIVEKHLTTQH